MVNVGKSMSEYKLTMLARCCRNNGHWGSARVLLLRRQWDEPEHRFVE